MGNTFNQYIGHADKNSMFGDTQPPEKATYNQNIILPKVDKLITRFMLTILKQIRSEKNIMTILVALFLLFIILLVDSAIILPYVKIDNNIDSNANLIFKISIAEIIIFLAYYFWRNNGLLAFALTLWSVPIILALASGYYLTSSMLLLSAFAVVVVCGVENLRNSALQKLKPEVRYRAGIVSLIPIGIGIFYIALEIGNAYCFLLLLLLSFMAWQFKKGNANTDLDTDATRADIL